MCIKSQKKACIAGRTFKSCLKQNFIRNFWYFCGVTQKSQQQLTNKFVKTTYLHTDPGALISEWQICSVPFGLC